MTIPTIILTYTLIGIFVLCVNCFIAGFSGEEPTIKDFREGLFWPITLIVLLGTIARLILEYTNKK